MVPNISKKHGRSFRGAAKYYFHDKAADKSLPNELKPKTDDRVMFFATLNCVNTDPDKAIDEMWKTAELQKELKMAAGVSLSGSRTRDPVKTLSLSWHPSERPTHDHMIETAKAYLKHMGWHEHQAVLLGHNDTPHLHIHIILNRIHPETGLTLDDYQERVRSKEWRREYEREQGRIWCEPWLQPGNENLRSASSTNVPHNIIEMTRPLERAFDTAEKQREALARLDWDMLKKQQREEREQFFKEGKKLFREARHAAYAEVRAIYKDAWREHYADVKRSRDHVQFVSKDAVLRAVHFMRQGDLDAAQEALSVKASVYEASEQHIKESAAELKDAQRKHTLEAQTAACDALRAARDLQYEQLLERQQLERDTMREAHARGERATELLDQTRSSSTANDNRDPQSSPPTPANTDRPPHEKAASAAMGREALRDFEGVVEQTPEYVGRRDATFFPSKETGRGDDRYDATIPEQPRARGLEDAAAGAIGNTANYIADQLGELFAPTPPEVLEANAKEQARRESEQPVPEQKDQNPFARHVEGAIRKAEAEQEKSRDDREYWDERERRRDR